MKGLLQSGTGANVLPLEGIHLYLCKANEEHRVTVANATTGSHGAFEMTPVVDSPPGIFYVRGDYDLQGMDLLAVLGAELPETIVINELTTVAGVYSANRFLSDRELQGSSLGLKIASAMNANLVDVTTALTALRTVRIIGGRDWKEERMTTARRAPADIDDYIGGFPPEVQKVLKRIRTAIQKAVPGAEEAISYQIPTFRLHGKNLIHFAAFKEHVGVYPAPREDAEFKEELARYGGGKGTVQFPFDEALPLDLIRRIARFRARQLAR